MSQKNRNVEDIEPHLAEAKPDTGSLKPGNNGSAPVIDFASRAAETSAADRRRYSGEDTLVSEREVKLNRVSFYHLHLDNLNTEESLRYCRDCLATGEPHAIYFINAHCFNMSKDDKDYCTALEQCDLLLNDGIGIRIAAKLEGIELKENMNGTDFIPKVMELSAQTGEGVYLLGAEPGVAETASANLQERMPNLDVRGTHHGFFSAADEDRVIESINSSGASVLVVGLGVPAQEKWIERNKNRMPNVRILLAGGAIIDFTAGKVKRAPRFMQKVGLEWLFRLLQEPKRLFGRYVIGNLRFLGLVARHKYR